MSTTRLKQTSTLIPSNEFQAIYELNDGTVNTARLKKMILNSPILKIRVNNVIMS